jgi:hypothetical protein
MIPLHTGYIKVASGKHSPACSYQTAAVSAIAATPLPQKMHEMFYLQP